MDITNNLVSVNYNGTDYPVISITSNDSNIIITAEGKIEYDNERNRFMKLQRTPENEQYETQP